MIETKPVKIAKTVWKKIKEDRDKLTKDTGITQTFSSTIDNYHKQLNKNDKR